jgi:primosomal protein N'
MSFLTQMKVISTIFMMKEGAHINLTLIMFLMPDQLSNNREFRAAQRLKQLPY